jgi:tetratricopeptide (TPR) repeat protein
VNATRISNAIGLILLLAVTFWVFHGCLQNPFHFDDALFLQSPQVTEPGDPWFLLKPSQTRQITYLTFYWNYRLGAADPVGYHWVNLILHLANILSVYFLVRILLRKHVPRLRRSATSHGTIPASRPGLRTGGSSDLLLNASPGAPRAREGRLRLEQQLFDPFVQRWLPIAASGVFALHPVQTEPINYVYQRSTLLAALFLISSMISYFLFLETHRKPGWLISTGICFCLAVASKEAALALPLVWVALVWVQSPGWRSFGKSMMRARGFLAMVLMAASWAAWTAFNLNRRGERTVGLGLITHSVRYLIAQVQVLAQYLGLLLVPLKLSIEHDFQPPPVTSLSFVLSLGLLAGIIMLCVLVRRRNPLLALLTLGFLILLLPTSSIVPSKDLLFEHRLYLPMVFSATLIAWGILALARRIGRDDGYRVMAAFVGLILLLGTYGVLSKKRTATWGSATRLWQDAADKAPLNPRAHYNLAISYLERDREKAREELMTTLILDSKHAAALYNLGWLAQGDRAYETARKYYELALQADPATWQARQSLGNLCILAGDLQGAVREFRETIRLKPDCWPAHLSLADLLLRMGDAQGSLAVLQNLVQVRWDLLEARYLRACGFIDEGKFAEAENELNFIAARDAGQAYGERIATLRKLFPGKQ